MLEARENVLKLKELLGTSEKDKSKYRPSLVLRINDLQTKDIHFDMKIIASMRSNIDAILVPKVDSLSSLEKIMNLVHSSDIGRSVPIWSMIETAKAIQNVEEIANAEFVECLVFGGQDLSKELHVKSIHKESLLYSMSRCIVAAR